MVDDVVVSRKDPKDYKGQGVKEIYVFFKSGCKAILPAYLDSKIRRGSVIKFKNHASPKGWYNASDFAEVIKDKDRPYEFILHHVTKARKNKNGDTYFSSFFPENLNDKRPIEHVYIAYHVLSRYKKVMMPEYNEPTPEQIEEIRKEWGDWHNHPKYRLPSYRKVRVVGNSNDKTLFVKDILSISEVVDELDFETDASHVVFHKNKIDIEYKGDLYVNIDPEFECSSVLNSVKDKIEGIIKVKGVWKLGGSLTKEDDKWVNTIKHFPFKNVEVEVDSNTLEKIKGVLNEDRLTGAWKEVVSTMQARFYASIEDIQEVLENHGVKMTEADIISAVSEKDYDSEYFDLINKYKERHNGKLYTSEKGFAFVIRGVAIFEKPVQGRATYVFRAVDNIDDLFMRFTQTPKKLFFKDYDDKGAKEESGFIGRVIHTEAEVWFERLESLINSV